MKIFIQCCLFSWALKFQPLSPYKNLTSRLILKSTRTTGNRILANMFLNHINIHHDLYILKLTILPVPLR